MTTKLNHSFYLFTDDEFQDTKPSPALLAKSLEDYVQDDDCKSLPGHSIDFQTICTTVPFQLITTMKIPVAINSTGQPMPRKR